LRFNGSRIPRTGNRSVIRDAQIPTCRVVLRDSDDAAAVREILRLALQKHPQGDPMAATDPREACDQGL
jgi:hypothetical protein